MGCSCFSLLESISPYKFSRIALTRSTRPLGCMNFDKNIGPRSSINVSCCWMLLMRSKSLRRPFDKLLLQNEKKSPERLLSYLTIKRRAPENAREWKLRFWNPKQLFNFQPQPHVSPCMRAKRRCTLARLCVDDAGWNSSVERARAGAPTDAKDGSNGAKRTWHTKTKKILGEFRKQEKGGKRRAY